MSWRLRSRPDLTARLSKSTAWMWTLRRRRRNREKPKTASRETQRRSQADAVHDRDQEIADLRERGESLVARICLAEGDAQRLGIDPVELWKP